MIPFLIKNGVGGERNIFYFRKFEKFRYNHDFVRMPNRNKSPYSASFTAAALMHSEMNAVLPYLMEDDSYQTVKMIENSLEILPIKSVSARERVTLEMVKRYRAVSRAFWEDYQSMSEDQQRLALFYVILKTYRLIFEFQVNVAVKKFNSANNTLRIDDLWMEFYDIGSRDAFVECWTDSTKKKCIQSYLTILKQVGLLNPDTAELQRASVPSATFVPYVRMGEPWFLQACFLPQYEIEDIKTAVL